MGLQEGAKAVSMGWITIIVMLPVAGIVVPILLWLVGSAASVSVPPTGYVIPGVILPAVGGAVATRSYSDSSKTAVIAGGVAGGLGGSTIGFLIGVILAVIALGMTPGGVQVDSGQAFFQYGGLGVVIGAGAGFVVGTIGGLLARHWHTR